MLKVSPTWRKVQSSFFSERTYKVKNTIEMTREIQVQDLLFLDTGGWQNLISQSIVPAFMEKFAINVFVFCRKAKMNMLHLEGVVLLYVNIEDLKKE